MRASRITAGMLALPLVFALAACGGGEDGRSKSEDVLPTKGSATPAQPQGTQPKPGSTELPNPVAVDSLSTADGAEGLVLVKQEQDGGCTVLTYSGELKKLGTFSAFTAEHKPRATQCGVRREYSSDFTQRVGEIYADWKSKNSFDIHTVVQSLGEPEKDITKAGERLIDPVIGPDDRVYAKRGGNFLGTPSVMNLDGTGMQEVENGKPRPAWIGGKMVKAEALAKVVSNADGSLAVEYLGDDSGYRVGQLQEKSGPLIEGDIVFPSSGQALKPLAWAGNDKFLTANGHTLYINTVVTGGAKPDVTTKELAVLPEHLTQGTASFQKVVVCGEQAYFVTQQGGTRTLPQEQSVLVSVGLGSGKTAVHASIQATETPGTAYGTEVLGCK